MRHFIIWKELENNKSGEINNIDEQYLTKKAHFDSALMHLFRLIDEHPDSKGIEKYLGFVGNHPRIFRKIEPEIVNKFINDDKASLKIMHKAVKNILGLRDKYYAHIDRKYFMNKDKAFNDYPVTPEDIENLFILIGGILGKYNEFFCDDYKRK